MPNINISLACKEIESIQPNSGCLGSSDYKLAVSLAGVSTGEIIEEIGVTNTLTAIDDDVILEYVKANITGEI